MSLLGSAVRRLLTEQREELHVLGGDAPAFATAQPSTWRLLGAEPGVQEAPYADVARPGVQQLFRHEPRRLLDMGCASGAVGAGLKQSIRGLWVWGCELNEQAAKIAASRLDHVSTLPRAQWSQDDLAHVRSLDTVLLLDVLEHMYNPWGELEFLAKHLPADAQVIVSIPNIRHVSILESLARGAFPYAPTGILDITHIRFFTPAGMEQMFNETGFEVEQTWILTMSQTTKIERFPAQVSAGKLTLTVESEQEWDQLNAVQFGFRLRPKPRA